MRRGSCILTLTLMGALALPGSSASAQAYSPQHSGVQVDVGIFYDSLAPQGDWVEMPDYGWSWAPRVERGWRPYTRGQWVMTDDGWFWDSDEQFGWATYHYGRWVNDRYYGWVWVPGTEWAPAWVSWRHGNGYTGWAPLPPRATWQNRVGLSIGGLDIDAFIGSGDYAFVPDRAFVDRGVYQRVLPPTQNVTIINVTNNVTNYTVVNERVVNGGIAVANVERAVGRRVPRSRTVDADRADSPRHPRADEVAVFRPVVRAAPERRPAQGRSLVKGDEPPPELMARRNEREQDRQQRGNAPDDTAKAVQQPRPAGQPGAKAPKALVQETPRPDAKAPPREAPRPRDQARQDADKERAKGQDPPQAHPKAPATRPVPAPQPPQHEPKARPRPQDARPQPQAKDNPTDAQPQAKDSPKGRDKGKDKGKDKTNDGQ